MSALAPPPSALAPPALREFLRANPDEVRFVAGLMTGRGKMYLGSSSRPAGDRFTPSLSVEVSNAQDVPSLFLMLGEPHIRSYYGKECFRFVSQDRERIGVLTSHLIPMLPPRLAERARVLNDFCYADTQAERAGLLARFRALEAS